MRLVEVIAAGVLLLGAVFMATAAIGVLRMPDLFMRMSAASKGASLGASLALGAVALHFGDGPVSARAVATIVFVFLTVPVAAHLVARAAYVSGVKISRNTRIDELRGHYAAETLELEGDGEAR